MTINIDKKFVVFARITVDICIVPREEPAVTKNAAAANAIRGKPAAPTNDDEPPPK